VPIREATARLLKRNGYVVRSARDGLEGIELLRHWPEADLVVLEDLGPSLRKPWHAPDLLALVRGVLDAAVPSVA
jgi:hypothetical protein